MAEMVKGIYLKTPHENAPDWVLRKVSVNVEQFIEYLQANVNESGYVNFDLNEAKSKHWYLQKDDWKPDNTTGSYSGQNGTGTTGTNTSTPAFQSFKPQAPVASEFSGKKKFEDLDIPF